MIKREGVKDMKSLLITTKEMFLGCGEYVNIVDGYLEPSQLFGLDIDELFNNVKVYPWAFDFIVNNTEMNALSVVTDEIYTGNTYVIKYLSTFVKLDEFKKKTKEMKFLKDRHFNLVINISNLSNIQIDNVLSIIEEINIKSDVEYIIVLNEKCHQVLLDNLDWFGAVLDYTRFKNIDVHKKENGKIKKIRFKSEYDTSVNFDVRFQWSFEYDSKRNKELYLYSGNDVLLEHEVAELCNKRRENIFTSPEIRAKVQEQSKEVFAFTDEEIEKDVEDLKKNGFKHLNKCEEIYELVEKGGNKTFKVSKNTDKN